MLQGGLGWGATGPLGGGGGVAATPLLRSQKLCPQTVETGRDRDVATPLLWSVTGGGVARHPLSSRVVAFVCCVLGKRDSEYNEGRLQQGRLPHWRSEARPRIDLCKKHLPFSLKVLCNHLQIECF